MSLGRDFRAENLRNARMNVGKDMSVTTSRCMALVVAHVKRHMYALLSVPASFTCSAPVKSTPVISKAVFLEALLPVEVMDPGYYMPFRISSSM